MKKYILTATLLISTLISAPSLLLASDEGVTVDLSPLIYEIEQLKNDESVNPETIDNIINKIETAVEKKQQSVKSKATQQTPSQCAVKHLIHMPAGISGSAFHVNNILNFCREQLKKK